jgi:hypothetical protein
VHDLQQALSLLTSPPLLALPEAAELLADHLGVDLVGCVRGPMLLPLRSPPRCSLAEGGLALGGGREG